MKIYTVSEFEYEKLAYYKTEWLYKFLFRELISSVITFKSNDFIIKEIYLSKLFIEGYDINSLIEFRDEKRVKYTRTAVDGSIEEHDQVISNKEFIENLTDDSFKVLIS